MAELVGGLRDRMIVVSFERMLHASLSALGWFSADPNLVDPPITWTTEPLDHHDSVTANTLAVTFEEVTDDDAEMGSNAAELTHVPYIDFIAQDRALGKHVIGDVRSILRGELPAIGRDRPILPVYDWTVATPYVAFHCSIIDVETTRFRSFDQAWQKNWYIAFCKVVEDRG